MALRISPRMVDGKVAPVFSFSISVEIPDVGSIVEPVTRWGSHSLRF